MAIRAQMPEQTGPLEPPLFMGSVRYTPGGSADSSLISIADENAFDPEQLHRFAYRRISGEPGWRDTI